MKKITKTTISKFRLYLSEEEKSKATIEKYLRDVNAFSLWLKNNELTKKHVLEYKEYLTTKYAPKSVNSVLSSLNSFFSFIGVNELKVKTLKIQKQLFLNNEKMLTKEEYNRLLKSAREKGNKRLFLIMQTICSCGIRVSELKYITVACVKCGKAHINLKGKIRIVILPKKLCKALTQYIKKENIKEGSIFVSKNGNPLNRSNIWKMMKNLCDAANVEKSKVFPHNLRHLFARMYYSVEKDIVRLADILGHSSVETTRIYTMENGDIHRRQIDSLGLCGYFDS